MDEFDRNCGSRQRTQAIIPRFGVPGNALDAVSQSQGRQRCRRAAADPVRPPGMHTPG
jgi:hypothetical protein